VNQFAKIVFLATASVWAANPLQAQQKQPYEKALVESGYQPTGEGARKYLRSLVPNQQTRNVAGKLLADLDSAEYHRREAATQRLLTMPNLPFALLNQAAESGSFEVRWRASHVLEHSQEKSGRLLLASLKIIEQDPPTQATADILRVVPYCRQQYVISAVHAALRSVATEDDLPVFAERLADPNAKVRLAAIVGIAQLTRGDAAARLRPLLDDADDEVSLAAARALANAGDHSCLECLLRLLDSTDSRVRAESASILRALTHESFQFIPYESVEHRRSAVARWKQWIAQEGTSAKLHYPLPKRSLARGALNGNTLVSTGSKGKVMEIDPGGNEVWTYNLAANSAEKLPGGNVLAASYSAKKVVEIDRAGNIVWELNGPSAMNAKPLLNGNFLVADFAGRRVLEVDRKKRIVWQCETTAQCFDADRLPNGNTIYGCPNEIREVTPDGDTVHQWEIPGRLNGFQALANGNVLVANYGQSKVYELTRDGEIIWEMPEPKPCDVFLLDGGRLLVSTATRIVEVGRNKRVLRVLADARYGSARR